MALNLPSTLTLTTIRQLIVLSIVSNGSEMLTSEIIAQYEKITSRSLSLGRINQILSLFVRHGFVLKERRPPGETRGARSAYMYSIAPAGTAVLVAHRALFLDLWPEDVPEFVFSF